MRPSLLPATLAASVLAAAPTAHAAGFELGLAAGGDRGRVECVASFACDRSSGFVRASGGWRFDSGVDVRLQVFDGGRFKGGDTTDGGLAFGGTFEVAGVGVTAGWRWTFAPQWDLDVRGGLAAVRTRFEYADDAGSPRSKTTTQPLAGIGIGYALAPRWRIGVDLDVTRLKANRRNGSLQMLGASARHSF